MRILTEVRKYNPDVKFLLENVVMSKKWEAVLTNAIGVEPVKINSNLVSAQNRKRLYWTNIAEIAQPEDEGIFIRDILEDDVDEKYYISGGGITDQMGENLKSVDGKAYCLTYERTEYGKKIRKDYESGKIKEQRKNIRRLVPRKDGKSNCLTTVQKDNLIVASRGRTGADGITRQHLEPRTDGKSNCLTTVQKDNLLAVLKDISPRVVGVSISENGIRPHRGTRGSPVSENWGLSGLNLLKRTRS